MSGSKLLNDFFTRAAPDAIAQSATKAADQPLGLTVHTLPSPARAMDAQNRRTGSGRWKMLAVLLVCAAPVLASYVTFYVLRPEGRRSFGELIEPQRTLPALSVLSLNGQASSLTALKGQWLFVSVANAACDEVCRRHLYLQRQLREGLGKDKARVDWVWLIPDAAAVPDPLLPALKEAWVLRIDRQALSNWLEPASGHQLAEHLYLVDPLGNWMMRFPANLELASAAKVKRDMERLLRASNSWDQPGRVTATAADAGNAR